MCELVDLYKNALGIGKGCCAPFNTWRETVRERKEIYGHSDTFHHPTPTDSVI